MKELEVTLIFRVNPNIDIKSLKSLNYYEINPTMAFSGDVNTAESSNQYTCKKNIQPEEIRDISTIGKELEKLGITIEERIFCLRKPKFHIAIIPIVISFLITFLTVYHSLGMPDCNPEKDKNCSLFISHILTALYPAIISALFISAATFFRKLDFL